jgi:hypothetical protein
MSVGNGLRDSAFWFDRAEEARMRADEMHDLAARATMLDVARLYDVMARHALEREARQGQSDPN